MILPILVLPLDGPPKHIFCCVVFLLQGKGALEGFPRFCLGFAFLLQAF